MMRLFPPRLAIVLLSLTLALAGCADELPGSTVDHQTEVTDDFRVQLFKADQPNLYRARLVFGEAPEGVLAWTESLTEAELRGALDDLANDELVVSPGDNWITVTGSSLRMRGPLDHDDDARKALAAYVDGLLRSERLDIEDRRGRCNLGEALAGDHQRGHDAYLQLHEGLDVVMVGYARPPEVVVEAALDGRFEPARRGWLEWATDTYFSLWEVVSFGGVDAGDTYAWYAFRLVGDEGEVLMESGRFRRAETRDQALADARDLLSQCTP